MSRFTKKIWGTVCRGERCDAYTIEHISVLPRFCCSIHRHHYRHNQFILLSGTLAVLTWPGYAGMTFPSGINLEEAYRDATINIDSVGGDQPTSLFVPAQMLHQFVSLTPVEATEIYTPRGTSSRLSLEDIERFSQGGPAPQSLLDRLGAIGNNQEWR